MSSFTLPRWFGRKSKNKKEKSKSIANIADLNNIPNSLGIQSSNSVAHIATGEAEKTKTIPATATPPLATSQQKRPTSLIVGPKDLLDALGVGATASERNLLQHEIEKRGLRHRQQEAETANVYENFSPYVTTAESFQVAADSHGVGAVYSTATVTGSLSRRRDLKLSDFSDTNDFRSQVEEPRSSLRGLSSSLSLTQSAQYLDENEEAAALSTSTPRGIHSHGQEYEDDDEVFQSQKDEPYYDNFYGATTGYNERGIDVNVMVVPPPRHYSQEGLRLFCCFSLPDFGLSKELAA